MYRAQSFLVVIFALFSVCLGATLMQLSVAPIPGYNQDVAKADDSCRALVVKHEKNLNKKIAKVIYQEALKHSFDGQWVEAQKASECAAWLEHGNKDWDIEAKNLLK
jgi:hypothetical protein